MIKTGFLFSFGFNLNPLGEDCEERTVNISQRLGRYLFFFRVRGEIFRRDARARGEGWLPLINNLCMEVTDQFPRGTPIQREFWSLSEYEENEKIGPSLQASHFLFACSRPAPCTLQQQQQNWRRLLSYFLFWFFKLVSSTQWVVRFVVLHHVCFVW